MSKALHIRIDNDSGNKNDDYDDDRSENKTKQLRRRAKARNQTTGIKCENFHFCVQFCDIFRLLYNHWSANNQIAMNATTHSLSMN